MGIVTRIKEDLGLPITSLTVRLTDTALGSPAVGVHLSVTAPDGHALATARGGPAAGNKKTPPAPARKL